MVAIRKQISRPYLTIISLMPLTILILFNFIVNSYVQKQAQTDLKQAVESISVELMEESTTDSEMSSISGNKLHVGTQFTGNLISIINSQNYSSEADLIVFNVGGELSKVYNGNSFITDELAQLIYEKTDSLEIDSVGKLKFEGDTYYMMKVNYVGSLMTNRMVYITKGMILDEFVIVINAVLVGVLILITGIALFVSSRVTDAVAKPIERLTGLVENIKSDEILVIDNNSNSIELARLISEINELNKRIYHYDQSQKNFLHNASHELRTPLMSIQGYADGIEMGVFKDYQGTAHLISEQSKRLTNLVDSLLKLARAENFNTNKKLEYLDLSQQLNDVVVGYKGYAMSQNIALETKIEPDIFANCNVELLQGCVGNIISNALRYGKNTVAITLEKRGDDIVIMIQDDGPGVVHIDKIFDRFSKGEDGNFGLGLSIAKTSAKMMNGNIRVSNDKGAIFEVILEDKKEK